MKMQFVLGVQGNDSLEKKFETAIKENKELHMQLIKSFAHAVITALSLTEEDNLTIYSFRAHPVLENPIEAENSVAS
jgi:hypothetical protein